MENNNWFADLEQHPRVDYISGEVYITDDPSVIRVRNYPHKNEVTITCICIRGEVKGEINLIPVHAKACGLLILLPDQILQYESFSEDFQGVFIIMSKLFIEKINIPEAFPTFMSIRNVPYLPLKEKELNGILNYCNMLKNVLRNTEEDFNRKAIVKHLTLAFFYGLGYYLHKQESKNQKNRNEIIMEDFLKLVQKHYKQERSIRFYADKLCITSKYLYVIVKNASGKSARQWIDDYVILEAKSLLTSTTFTVQQISDQLNFPSQSFFGKYFKREVGTSPAQYRKCNTVN